MSKLNPKVFMQIAEQALTGMMVFNARTRECLYANQQARETLDVTGETAAIRLEELYPGAVANPRFRDFCADLLSFEGLFQEIMMRKLSGDKFVASLGVRNIDVEGEQYVLLMFQDMTVQVKLQRELESKQAQINAAYQELIVQNAQLKDLDLAKNRFIALVTHELRTPVSGIVSSAEVLKLKLYDSDEQRDEFIGMIHSEGQHMLELINDILDFAKIQAGKMEFYVEHKDAAAVVRHEMELLQTMADQYQIQMRFRPPAAPALCYFDDLRLKQVVANVINNAIKYNLPQGRVDIWFEETPDTWVLYVKDTGKGIKPEDQPKIFNEFETLGKISLHNKGTGLGMPITRRLLKGMGGTIQLTSEVGVGTTFWITLPKNKVLEESLYRSRADDDSGDLAA